MGAGETWEGTYTFAHKHNLAVVGGTCGTVGVAGWLHGGGHSPLTTKYGMGADNLRQVEIVTPDGAVKIANECQNPDLFFAVRGGGGGTFGVVTNITYRALPLFEVQVRLCVKSSISLTSFRNLASTPALLLIMQKLVSFLRSLPRTRSNGQRKGGVVTSSQSRCSKTVPFSSCVQALALMMLKKTCRL